MTVSAPTRFSPAPPALSEIREKSPRRRPRAAGAVSVRRAGAARPGARPAPARLERDQEDVRAALLERVDRLLAIGRAAGQRDVADAAREQALADQAEHARELREHQDAAAVG